MFFEMQNLAVVSTIFSSSSIAILSIDFKFSSTGKYNRCFNYFFFYIKAKPPIVTIFSGNGNSNRWFKDFSSCIIANLSVVSIFYLKWKIEQLFQRFFDLGL